MLESKIVKTEIVAGWNPKRSGVMRCRAIKRARRALKKRSPLNEYILMVMDGRSIVDFAFTTRGPWLGGVDDR